MSGNHAALSQALGSAQPDGRPLRITLTKSLHGQLSSIAASARGLGLRRPQQSVVVADTAANRGMIRAAIHLLAVQRSAPDAKDKRGRHVSE
jgi:large subunit ribosomal protein L30